MYSMRWSHYRGSPSDGLAGAAAGGMVLLAVVVLLLLLYLAYLAARLIGRTVAQHPHNRVLRIALTVFAARWGWAIVALPQAPRSALAVTFLALAILSALALLCVARVIEIYYDNQAQRPITKETVIADVLDFPWWRSARDAA